MPYFDCAACILRGNLRFTSLIIPGTTGIFGIVVYLQVIFFPSFPFCRENIFPSHHEILDIPMFDKILRSLAVTIPLSIEVITDAATGIPLKRNGMDIKRVDKLLPEIVSHIPHKISRFVWFYGA